MTALDEEIGARERAATLQVTSPHSIVKKTPPTARAMLTTNTCAYCGQGHTASSCPTVTDTDARRQVLRKTGRCYNCLRRKHTVRDCRSTIATAMEDITLVFVATRLLQGHSLPRGHPTHKYVSSLQ